MTVIPDRQAVLDALLDEYKFLPKPTPAPARNGVHRNGSGRMSDEDRCWKYLIETPDAISGNDGHGKTLRAACECVRFDLDPAATWRIMRRWNDEKSDEKWTDKELEHKIASAEKHAGPERGSRNRQQHNANLRPSLDQTPGPAADSGDAAAQPGRLQYVDACDVKPKQVDWLMDRRIPAAMLVTVAGVQGDGKSMILADFTASISAGRPFALTPDVPNPAGRVIVFASEDSFEYTLAPRLAAHGADMSRVRLIDTVTDPDGTTRLFSVTRDLHLLERMVEELGDVRAVIFDPINTFLGANINPNKDEHVRPALESLKRFCEARQVSVLCVKHLNKSTMENALHRVSGASAYTEVPRCVWFVLRDRLDFQNRKLICGKMNVAAFPPGAMFTIEHDRVQWLSADLAENATEAMRQDEHDEDTSRSKVEEASDWLTKALADGQQRAKVILTEARENGISSRTLERAKATLGIKSECSTASGKRVWMWSLPGTSLTPLDGGVGEHGGVGDVRQGRQERQGCHTTTGPPSALQ